LDFLKVKRINHGVRCVEDAGLAERLVDEQIPLPVCPLSDLKLRVFDTLEQHNLGLLLLHGICGKINSDDPASFGGTISENYFRTQQAFKLDAADIFTLIKNSFTTSFLSDLDKQRYIAELVQAKNE